MTTTINYEVQRGQSWVKLDAEDVRWEVKEEAESSEETSGIVECGGQSYCWAKVNSEAVSECRKAGGVDRAAYISEFGEDPVVGQVGDWDATGWGEAWQEIANRLDIELDDEETYKAARIAYLSSLFTTDDVA